MKKFIPKIEKVPFTKEGFEELKKKREMLLSERPAAVKELQRARELGDLSENGLYKAARSRLSGIDAQLRRYDSLIKRAEISETSSGGSVQIGSKVTVNDSGKKIVYKVVGEFEADPKEQKISQLSPIGKALIGKEEGAIVEIVTPAGTKKLEVLVIE